MMHTIVDTEVPIAARAERFASAFNMLRFAAIEARQRNVNISVRETGLMVFGRKRSEIVPWLDCTANQLERTIDRVSKL